ncbi:MAG: ATP-dependent protease HslVU (ClpYQ) peptidase subunit [Dokdonia sp.]|jgi:ATP-dependent protease HslVU (ClpYQ) peptidase subunit
MTLIIGVLYRGTVHIIADSVETVPNSIKTGGHIDGKYYEPSTSSLGNIIDDVNGCKVIESSQKIYQVTNKFIVAFSGSTIKGREIIQDLEIRILSSPNDGIAKILKDYFEEAKPENNEFIFGVSDGVSIKMITFTKNKFTISSTEGFMMIGNGVDQQNLRDPLIRALMDLSAKDLKSKDFLVSITAIFQCLILNSNSYVKGVGGFVNSALLHSDGVYWLDDTIKLLYSSNNFKKGDESIHFQCTRDQITFIKSTFIQASIYMNSGFSFSTNYIDWKDRWLDEVLELSSKLNAEYYLLISYDNLRVTIIENSTNLAKYLSVNIQRDDKVSNIYKPVYHPDLIDIITQDSTSKDIILNLL